MDFDFALRIFIAGMLGGAIGLEREYRAKEAGFRTHFLVSLGSALFMILSHSGFDFILQDGNRNRLYWCGHHNLSETCGTWVNYGSRSLGYVGHRFDLWFGYVCLGHFGHGDGTYLS